MSHVKYCITIKDANEPTKLYVISRFIIDAENDVTEDNPVIDDSLAFGARVVYKLAANPGGTAKDVLMGNWVDVSPNWTDPTFPAYHRIETLLNNTNGTPNSVKGMDTKNSPTL